MSSRRKQSIKDLGAILSEAVPVVVAEEVQRPAVVPPPQPAEAEPPASRAEAAPEAEAAAAPEAEAAAAPEAEAVTEAEAAAARHEPAEETDGAAAVASQTETETPAAAQVPEAEAAPALEGSEELRAAAVAEAPAGEATPVLWRKSTIPFREDQYAEIGHVLADFFLRNDVQLTIAEVVRLGLDKMIEALREPELREGVLQELYRQQRRERLVNEKLKHSKSRGLGDYLAARGQLPG